MNYRFALSAVLLAFPARAQDTVKPYIMLDIDTSGSMAWHICEDGFIPPLPDIVDDAIECPASDVTCATCNGAGCDNSIADDGRLWKVKKGVAEVINSFGEVTYALARYHQVPAFFQCPAGSWDGACTGGFAGGGADILVPFADGNEQDLLEWIDYCDNWPTTNDCDPTSNIAPESGCSLCPDCGGSCDKELRPAGATPIAGSLISVEQYLGQVLANDPQFACRPYVTIALTDGQESCDDQPAAVAAAASICNNLGIPVYVVGFADPTLIPNLDEIADAGCDSPCAARGCRDSAIFVDNEADLALAFADIIQGSVLFEKCNGVDDDCDGLIDEDFPGLGDPCCDPCNGQIVCNAAGDGTICNGFGPCVEECNAEDDDCDGLIDEGLMCPYEICNGIDDNMNGQTDELPLPGLGQACGTDEGECTPGLTCCDQGAFACCGSDAPVPESCNCLDDNCNGMTDESGSRRCYAGPPAQCPDPESGRCNGICQPGVQTCVTTGCPGSPGFGTCVGEIGPRPEACNCLDDNCNGFIDDGAVCPSGAPCTNCGCPYVCDPTAEFPCEAGYVCSNGCPDSPDPPVCLPDPCLGTSCGLGEQCEKCEGDCIDLCADVKCGPGQPCCAGLCCESWQTCQDLDGDGLAQCGDNTCSNPAFPCAEGEVCKDHVCIADPCTASKCEADEGCIDGKCFAVCPTCRDDQICLEGRCVSDPCAADNCIGANVICCEGVCTNDPCAASVTCNPGEYCDGCTAACREDTCPRTRCPSGYQCDRGQCQPPANVAAQVSDFAAVGSGGCGCTVGTAGGSGAWAFGLALLFALALRRRALRVLAALIPLAFWGGCEVNVLSFNEETDAAVTGDMGVDEGICEGRSPVAEVCNGFDDDCDGVIDNGNPQGGGPCGVGCLGDEEAGDTCPQRGVCTHGVKTCVAGGVVCIGDVKPMAETCNGLDDSCDDPTSMTDEVFDFCNSPDNCGGCGGVDTAYNCPSDCPPTCGDGTCAPAEKAAATCPADCPDTCGDGACSAVTNETACTCRLDCPAACGDGCCTPGETPSTCAMDCPASCGDLQCSGTYDTPGNCGNIPQAVGICDKSACGAGNCSDCAVCRIDLCETGWVDCQGDVPPNDCDCPCSASPGPEQCDGVDNDCNGVTDDAVSTPNFCRQLGACGGASPVCLGAQGWCCNYGPDVEIEPDTNPCGTKVVTEEIVCDDIDGDCDGGTDEYYTNKNQMCSDSGIGACQGRGNWVCTPDMMGTECVITQPGSAPTHEACDGIDNDCDSTVDENTDGPSEPTCGGTCMGVNEALTSVGTLRIYTYEASRPGSTAGAQAANDNRACSRANVLPWVSITWDQATTACANAGLRLCTGTEWQNACQGAANTTWPFGNAASDGVDDDSDLASGDFDQCNGKEFDANAIVMDDQDAIVPTGSLAKCDSQDGAFDLAGNVQEWTSESQGSGYVVRGGAFDDTAVGLECDNTFSVLPPTWTYPNTGFRCCCTSGVDCPP